MSLHDPDGRVAGEFQVAQGQGWMAVTVQCVGGCSSKPDAVWIVDIVSHRVRFKYNLPLLGCGDDPEVEGGAAPYMAVDPALGRVYVGSCQKPMMYVLGALKMALRKVQLPTQVQSFAIDNKRASVVIIGTRKQAFLINARTFVVARRITLGAETLGAAVDEDRLFLLSTGRVFIFNLPTGDLLASAVVPRDTECMSADPIEKLLYFHTGGDGIITEMSEAGSGHIVRSVAHATLLCDVRLDARRHLAVMAEENGQLRLLRTPEMRTISTLKLAEDGVFGWFDVDEHGQQVLFTGAGGGEDLEAVAL